MEKCHAMPTKDLDPIFSLSFKDLKGRFSIAYLMMLWIHLHLRENKHKPLTFEEKGVSKMDT